MKVKAGMDMLISGYRANFAAAGNNFPGQYPVPEQDRKKEGKMVMTGHVNSESRENGNNSCPGICLAELKGRYYV